MINVYTQLVLVAVMNALGQLFLKMGSGALDSVADLLETPLVVFQHPYFLGGTALYGVSFILYVNALSRVRLSVAYPFLGLTYVVVVFLSALVLEESVTLTTVIGALLVFAGVSLIGFGTAS